MDNDQIVAKINLFRYQIIFSKLLAIFSVVLISLVVFFGAVMTNVESYEGLLFFFNLLYMFILNVGHFIFFILNIIKYIKCKSEKSKSFLKLNILIFFLSASYFFIAIHFIHDGKFNLFMAPRDSGIFLFQLIFIVINLKVYRNIDSIELFSVK